MRARRGTALRSSGDPESLQAGRETQLVDALMQAYAAEYSIDPASVRAAAEYRARAMVTSDRWVKDGCDGNSPALAQEEEDLRRSYIALRAAVGPVLKS